MSRIGRQIILGGNTTKIIISGQCSMQWGRLEYGNIGNYYIIEPMFSVIREMFPDAEIVTTLQLTSEFINRFGVEVLPLSYYYDFDRKDNLAIAKKEAETARKLKDGVKTDDITPFLRVLTESDIFIEFSADLWGDRVYACNFGDDRLEVGLLKNFSAQCLCKRTVMLAGSPGPFSQYKMKEAALKIYRDFSLVVNREPASHAAMKMDGFDMTNSVVHACPSFLFSPQDDVSAFLKKENIGQSGLPVIGFVLCKWTFTGGSGGHEERPDDDFMPFVSLIEYMSQKYPCEIVLLSHANGFPIPPKQFELLHGSDYYFNKRLQELLDRRKIARNVHCCEGIYDAGQTKRLIGSFDMLITGKIHAAVAAWSQYVPAVVIEYGVGPKVAKFAGFSRLVGQEKYCCNPSFVEDMIDKVESCYLDRTHIRAELEKAIPSVKEDSLAGIQVLREL